MDYANFVDRDEELAYLRGILESPGFQFVPIWGRRRIGKTTLLLKALEGNGIYFLASEMADIENIRRFQDDASRCLDDPHVLDLTPDWEVIFRYIAKKGTAVVIDEFPYLISSNPAIPSIFQRIIDVHLKKSDTKFFLCGSSVKMMESQVLEYKAPLYGRRTGQIHLRPLDFTHLREFFPDYSFDDLVRVYGACGGIPMYLLEFRPDAPFWVNVEKRMLDPHSILYIDAELHLKQEFTHLATYKSILREVASGKTKMDEIRTALNAGKSDISPYLANLSTVGLVKRIVPITEVGTKSRRGIYRIDDNYLSFYFRYLLPRKSMIESSQARGVTEYIKKEYDAYLGRIFEQVVTEAFLTWSASRGVAWDQVGPWWYKEDEIDLVALSSARNEVLCCEVKWTKKPIGKSAVENLIKKTEKLRWGPPDRKERYLMVSRGGFTPSCMQLMESEGVAYWTIDELGDILWRG